MRRRQPTTEIRQRAVVERPIQPEPQPCPHAGGELGGRPRGHDRAAVEDADAIGHALHVAEVVARQEDRDPGCAKIGHDRPRRGTTLRIHPGGRLVEHHYLGSTDERECQPESLALAAGEPPIAGPRHRPEPDKVEELIRIARIDVEAAVLHERLAWLRPRIDATALEHQPDARPEGAPAATTDRRPGPAPCRRRPAGTPRRSRRSWSCPRRSVPAARRARRVPPPARRRRGRSARRTA